MATTTVGGLATGLNTDQIIQGLLAGDQARVQLLKNKQDKLTAEQTAFKSVEARLLTLQGQISQLAQPANGVLAIRNVASSDQSLVTAAAGNSATPGVYNVRVNSLARAHQIASQGFDSADSTITQGTLQLKVGSGATTITIDSTNNTLQGLANAINGSGVGVTAAIINDGSNSRTQPYRLLLTSNKLGVDNAITLTNNLAADASGARRPELAGSYIGLADTSADYTGTATPTVNTGVNGFSGTANNTYTFTVQTSGTVGTDDNLQIAYTDSSGAHSGTLTVNSGDAGVFKDVAQGIQVKLNAGTLVKGQTFTVDGFVSTVQQASNASVTVGSGDGALSVQSASNQIDGIIQGVTLNLLGADSSKDIALTVSNDTDKAKKAIQDFVSSYNDLLNFIDQQVQYDPETKQAGVLLGDQNVTSIEESVRNAVTNTVAGVNPKANRLSVLGITTNDQGQLALDQSKLDNVLNGGVAGVSFADVQRLFALTGSSSNAGIQFASGGAHTKATGTAIQVNLTQAAEQASITATNTLADSTVIDSSNNSLTFKVNGKTSSPITLASGTYTRANLAQELQAQINADSALGNQQVTVGVVANKLVVTSGLYGYASQAQVGTGTALTVLGFTGSESDRGQDVVGKFLVNGVAESAVGAGQFLQGSSTNANTAGLQVRVTLSSSQIQDGPEGSLTVSRGVASQLDALLSSLLDPTNGQLKSIDDGLNQQITDVQKVVDQQNASIQAKQQALVNQFVTLETTVSSLQSVGNFLGAQQANLKNLQQTGKSA
jgi:flagellar hook-associated protein 2